MKAFYVFSAVMMVTLGCGQSEADRTREAILRLLRADKAASERHVKTLPADASSTQLAKAIGDYYAELEQFDMSDCPAEFRVAYRSHLNAWKDAKRSVAQVPDGVVEGLLTGALNSMLLGEADGGYSRLQGESKLAFDRIRATFEEVERIGAKYGAAL